MKPAHEVTVDPKNALPGQRGRRPFEPLDVLGRVRWQRAAVVFDVVGRVAAPVVGAVGSGPEIDPQSCCLRAFFLRAVSLRLRFTLGFSKCSRRRASARMPLSWIFLLNRRSALSNVSF